jgi:hypothetical protein
MLLEVHRDECCNHISLIGLKITAGNQMIGQGSAFVAGPGLKSRDELDLVNETVLKREQAEEQVARTIDSRWHDSQLPVGDSSRR